MQCFSTISQILCFNVSKIIYFQSQLQDFLERAESLLSDTAQRTDIIARAKHKIRRRHNCVDERNAYFSLVEKLAESWPFYLRELHKITMYADLCFFCTIIIVYFTNTNITQNNTYVCMFKPQWHFLYLSISRCLAKQLNSPQYWHWSCHAIEDSSVLAQILPCN